MMSHMPDSVYRVAEDFEREFEGGEAIATELLINAVRLGDLLMNLIDSFVRTRGLPSASSLQVMEVLRGEFKVSGQGLSPSVVAARSLISRPALTGVMDTLERRGLLRREPEPSDRRRHYVEMTEAGRALMDELLPALHAAEAQWTRHIGTTQKQRLVRELGRVHAQVQAAADGVDRRDPSR